MAMQPSEHHGNSNHAEPPAAYVEDVRVSVGSAPSQSRGGPELSENVVDELYYQTLMQDALKGDWESAERFFKQDSASKTAKITSRSETVLHIAALSAQDQFLEKLVELLFPYPEALEEVDCDGRTALHNAVLCGSIRMVKALVKSNTKLTRLADNKGRIPLGIAALEASMHKEVAWFLAEKTTDDEPSNPFSSPSAIEIIIDLTYAGHHDITLHLVGQYPHLITMKSTKDKSILDVLALMPSHFPSGTRLSVLEALIYKCIPVDLSYKPTDKNSDAVLQSLTRRLWNAIKIVVPVIKRVREIKLGHVVAVGLAKEVCTAISHMSTTEIADYFREGDLLFQVAVKGISELMRLCIQFFPKFIRISPHGKRLTTHAVEFRQERILRLFLKGSSTYEVSLVPAATWKESEDMMLAVANYIPNSDAETNYAGAVFQMQRELQWFKFAEKWSVPAVRTGKRDGITYWEIFVEKHKKLLENGEKWMKDTVDKCMLVSTLIATVLFTAAFTVPGGNDNNTGVPLLIGQNTFLVFAMSDGLGLVSSVMAILVFLHISISRHEPQDFLMVLPKKIILGQYALFVALGCMLVSFSATLTIVLDKRGEWVPIPITLMAYPLVALSIILQLPLLQQMVKFTYAPSIFRAESIWK